ncbi:phosphocholine cytidylyltransferase family protein [Verrucomicrobia bacterium]|nr:phosphocholine cytidylyltransferase family protein [Verrucomicrobiota bacterium]
MTKTKAILLSAGMARRLYPLTINKPKCLLPIHGENTLLDLQLKSLKQSSVESVSIITGFMSDLIEEKAKEYESCLDIEVIYNPFYAVSNNLASLWLGLQFIKEKSVLTINGDNLFSPAIVNSLLNEDNDITVAVAMKNVFDDDDMKVIFNTKDGLLKNIGKKLDHKSSNGESIGMIKYNETGLSLLNEKITFMLKNDTETIDLFYLEAIQRLVYDNHKIQTKTVDSNSWREMDYVEDYSKLCHDLSCGLIHEEFQKLIN